MGQSNTRSAARETGEVMTPVDVSRYLKMSQKTVIRRFKDGTLPAKRFGTKWRTLRTELDKALTAR